MPVSDIVIKGAREHNLRDVDIVLPRNQLICLTGVSGSGKSSLAFDTLYAEGQRRYVESLSSYARQFLGQMPKPDVDFIGGLSPSISISQKSTGNNPRSTVGTVTEIYDYLRVLFSRVGTGHCPRCSREITAQTREQIIARIIQLPQGETYNIMAPLIRGQKGEYRDLFEDLIKQGFVRARVDGQIVRLSNDLQLDRQMRHNIEVVIDRLTMKIGIRSRLAEAVELALKMGSGNLIVTPDKTKADDTQPASKGRRSAAQAGDIICSADYACTHCGISFEPPSPQLFSFNSPQGMCFECDGLGDLYSFDPALLVPDRSLSFKKGCFDLIGDWKKIGRWRRHIYQGVADTIERIKDLESGFLLETPWKDLKPSLKKVWLWGTGEQHLTFTWRGGRSPMKYGGQFEGIIPDLLTKYRNSKSKMQLRQLEKYMNTILCPDCHGERLVPQARSVKITTAHPRFADQPDRSLPEVCKLAISDAADFFSELKLNPTQAFIAVEALKEIRGRLGFLTNVGLDYLTLNRTAPTLSGGESQRIRLAGQIGSGLVGVLYILDEPSIGLHPRDNDRLLNTLCHLRDMGNTVVVVEHDEDTMRIADQIIDFGPGPGVRGGEVVAIGDMDQIARTPRSVTGQYLSGKQSIKIPKQRRPTDGNRLIIRGATHNNLKNVDVEIPLGALVCVTGVSGSGKSSLVNDILVEALRRDLNGGLGDPGAHAKIEGLDHLDKLIAIDQSPIGRTPRSNPGTYIKVFDDIRNLYAQLSESKRRGYKPGRFSFNVAAGRCEACEGNGSNRLEMDFLADIWVTCPVCQGNRFNRETLQVKFKDKSIADVLDMDIQQALELFENIPKIQHKLQTLHDVGLDYLKLGQPSPTLSGGEAQRIKLARELVKKSTGQTLYLLDEPTTGLHFADIQLLLKVLHGFVEAGNTVLVVEHNLDVIKTADWVIDLGPEGGDAGGEIVAAGPPEAIIKHKRSHTARVLAPLLNAKSKSKTGGSQKKKRTKKKAPTLAKVIRVQGARQHNLKDVDVEIVRDEMTVFCGPSGSGKSSLAMDTIYAEGQRRYVESLSAYARQFVSQMQKPQVDHIEGLSPAIAIEQKNLGHTPRSTVGTVTEIYDYLRILLARMGQPYCPQCDIAIGSQSTDEVIDKIMGHPQGERLYLMTPLEVEVGQQYDSLWEEIRSAGYVRIRVNGKIYSIDEPPEIDRRRKHNVEVVVDRIIVQPKSRSRIADSIENALDFGQGVMHVAYPSDDIPESRWKVVVHSLHLACEQCGRSFQPLTPHSFSFNSPLGWCEACEGLGLQIGANPAALIRDPKLTLAEGALDLWPNLDKKISQSMLQAFAQGTGIPLDEPLEQLAGRHRRIIMHGSDEQWFDVLPLGRKKKNVQPLFRFQFKGLYPALEEASRISPSLRGRLEHLVGEVECTTCCGSRLRDDASAVRFRDLTIDQLCRLPMGKLQQTIQDWKLSARDRKIAGEVLREVQNRVQFLNDVGLDYLSISRGAATLSNGEAQRIRLASQLGSGLCGVLYVLDEPTIGLHPRDNTRLLNALKKLRDLGNTLLIVEHDREIIENSDHVFDFGPAAGKHGGEVVASGKPTKIAKSRTSVTGPYLSGKKSIPIPSNRRPVFKPPEKPKIKRPVKKKKQKKLFEHGSNGRNSEAAMIQALTPQPTNCLEILGARQNNLQNIDVLIPLGALTAITGPSGSGKSSLIDEVLYRSLARTLHRAKTAPGAHDSIRGLEQINKVIRVDQNPIGNSPTSNPATYTGAFELVRVLFAQLPDSKLRGYTPRRFSFNAAGGRCDECEGNGQICIEMHFLPDVWVECETCRGRRYNEETLDVKFHGQSISDVLQMTCADAVELFKNIPKIRRILQTLCDVGLDYLTLGQSAPTLSGGEAQRVKLAAELSRPDTGRTLYLLDEPTTGLHFNDLAKLLEVLHRLVDLGNTVVVIEHNLDVAKSADWIIDMGPEAGEKGGYVVAVGTPEEIVTHAEKSLAVSGQRQNGKPKKKKTKKKVAAKRVKRIASDGDEAVSKSTELLRSHTGEALAKVLKAGPYKKRVNHDFEAAEKKRQEDMEISDVGREAKMPWEIDGRRWHTRDRVGRKGEPCRWDGKILGEVIDRIGKLYDRAEVNWNARGVVEITGKKKSEGWFFHAITGEAWLVKLKFRVAKGTFNRQRLIDRLALKTLNEMEELPVYGNNPRVKCKALRGPWQEVQIAVHSFDEVDTPEFWTFLEEAVAGFVKHVERVEFNPEDHMPWKKLGQKWHFLRKGFPPGRRVLWDAEVLEELHQILDETADSGQFLWNNQQVVHLFVSGQKEPWATLHTKRPESLTLTLTGPKNSVSLGRVAELGCDRRVDAAHPNKDVLKLKFRTVDDLYKGDLTVFLKEHFSDASNVAT